MWVKYFIPEDGDEPEHPNVFNIKIQGSLTLDQLEKNFPLSGKYIFRQLKKIGNMEVWMDVTPGQPLNDNDNSIFLKVSRQSSSPTEKVPPVTAPKPEPAKPPSVKQPSLLNLSDDHTTSAPNAASVAPTSTSSTPFFDDDLLNFSSAPQSSSTPKVHDPFGLDSLQPTPLASSSSFPANSPQIQPNNNNSYRGMGQQSKSFDPFSDLGGGLNSSNSNGYGGMRRY